MNRYKNLVNLIDSRLEFLSNYNKSTYDVLLEAEKYSLTAGGKHLRGLILIKVAMLGNIPVEDALDFACALEMVHTYSLIHDDLPEMDNDDIRRGKPTCHVKFGADIALLAGDALLTKAFEVIVNTTASPMVKLECIKILAAACGEHGMLAGQVIDKCYENKTASIEIIEELQHRKTGDMFVAAVKIGSALADLDADKEDLLVEYIKDLGLAFQIKDDILDVTSSEQVLGKPINSDIENSKSTFVSVLGLEKANELLNEKICNAKKAICDISDPFFAVLADYFAERIK